MHPSSRQWGAAAALAARPGAGTTAAAAAALPNAAAPAAGLTANAAAGGAAGVTSGCGSTAATAANTGGGVGGSFTGGGPVSARYEIISKIGEGTYGLVYLAAARDGSGRLYAIKTFKSGREGDGVSPTAVREIALLREMSHPNVVALEGVHVTRGSSNSSSSNGGATGSDAKGSGGGAGGTEASLSLAFGYCEHDLYEMIWHHRDRIQAPMHPYTVKSVLWQLLNGLSYMHQNWVVHRDLKPSNVLVTGEGAGEPGCVKIADFGLARVFQAPSRPLHDNGVVVTIWYRAPELLLGARHYTRALDVWAAGCIFAELMALRPLFQGAERRGGGAPLQADQLDRIFKVLGAPNSRDWPTLEALPHWRDNTENIRAPRSDWPSSSRLPDHLSRVLATQADAAVAAGRQDATPFRPSPAAVDLLGRMLTLDPARRITAEQALMHPYFTQEAPAPGPNAFVCEGRVVASYPRRARAPPPGGGPTVVATGAGGVGAGATGLGATGPIDAAGGALVAGLQPPLPPNPAPLAVPLPLASAAAGGQFGGHSGIVAAAQQPHSSYYQHGGVAAAALALGGGLSQPPALPAVGAYAAGTGHLAGAAGLSVGGMGGLGAAVPGVGAAAGVGAGHIAVTAAATHWQQAAVAPIGPVGYPPPQQQPAAVSLGLAAAQHYAPAVASAPLVLRAPLSLGGGSAAAAAAALQQGAAAQQQQQQQQQQQRGGRQQGSGHQRYRPY